MNGPNIDEIRLRLADELSAYREPISAPLEISPWVAMSCLQKAIRRAETDLAQRAAATLLRDAPERLWRRCGAVAFEDIGVADLETVSMVTAALAGKRFRATVGGEWKVASFVVDRMARAAKCRAADDLLLTAALATIARQLPPDPVRVLAIGIEHALDGRPEVAPHNQLRLRTWRLSAEFTQITNHVRGSTEEISVTTIEAVIFGMMLSWTPCLLLMTYLLWRAPFEPD